MTDAAQKGHNQEAALMAQVRSSLDDATEQVAKNTSEGETIGLLKQAIDKTREHKQAFETGAVKQIFRKGEAGYGLRESLVTQKAISTPEGAKAFVKAFGEKPEMINQAKGAIVDEMVSKSSDNWMKYFNDKRPQFKALFGDDFVKVKAVIEDLASEKGVFSLAQKATGRQSITAQGVTTAKWLEGNMPMVLKLLRGGKGTAIGAGLGTAVGQGPGFVVGTVLGKGAEKLAEKAALKIKQTLIKSMTDPQFAKILVSKASPGGIATILQVLGQSGIIGMSAEDKPQQSKLGQIANENVVNKSPLAYTQEETPQPIVSEPPARYGKQNVSAIVSQLPPLLKAVIDVESNGNPNAVSRSGARGLMQVMPANFKALGINDPHDPIQNITGGVKLLQEEYNRFKDLKLALAAYNAGSPAINRAIKRAGTKDWAKVRLFVPDETKDYVTKVLRKQYQYANA
jgi:hypothetical protein